MSAQEAGRKPKIDALMVVALSTMAISLNVGVHEGVHALTCLAVGAHLKLYSALFVDCQAPTVLQAKLVAGSAPVFNLVLGTLLWVWIRTKSRTSQAVWLLVWLLMLMNWLYGSGYGLFSGIANVGDIADVIAGWEPAGLWRVIMSFVGAGLFMGFVWLALRELGRHIGGTLDDLYGRATQMGLLAYATSLVVVLLAGLMSPAGFGSLPVVAGLLAVAGGLSPLLWMMQWFRAKMFVKVPGPALEIHRQPVWLAAAVVVGLLYAVILGRSIVF